MPKNEDFCVLSCGFSTGTDGSLTIINKTQQARIDRMHGLMDTKPRHHYTVSLKLQTYERHENVHEVFFCPLLFKVLFLSVCYFACLFVILPGSFCLLACLFFSRFIVCYYVFYLSVYPFVFLIGCAVNRLLVRKICYQFYTRKSLEAQVELLSKWIDSNIIPVK